MKLYKLILVAIFFFSFNSFGFSEPKESFLEWKRFSKTIVQEPHQVVTKKSINENKKGFYKISVDQNGKISYKNIFNEKLSDFNIYEGMTYKAVKKACAFFQKKIKLTYIKYKIIIKKNNINEFTGRYSNVKKIQYLSDERVSDWYLAGCNSSISQAYFEFYLSTFLS